MVIVGLILGLVGTDVNTGTQRFTFGVTDLFDGIGFIVVAVGVFAIAEIVSNLEQKEKREVFTDKVGSLMPSRDDLKQSALPIARGTLVGSVLGILPAGGALLSSFVAYAVEKKVAKDPSRFGKGAIEGVVGPEAANNAGAQTSFIPMLTLGIPPNVVMALMIGGMMIHNIQPGPQVMTKNPELFWGLIASMWLGNLMLVVLNLPLVGIWVRLLSLPYRFLYPAIILFCCIGVYTLSNNTFDVRMVVLFGALGYLLARIGCEPAPMLLGFILGPMMEEYFRRALIIERGDFMVFVNRPISATLLAAALLVARVDVAACYRQAGAGERVAAAGRRFERIPSPQPLRQWERGRRPSYSGVRPRPLNEADPDRGLLLVELAELLVPHRSLVDAIGVEQLLHPLALAARDHQVRQALHDLLRHAGRSDRADVALHLEGLGCHALLQVGRYVRQLAHARRLRHRNRSACARLDEH